MKLEIKATGINNEAVKILTKAVKKVYSQCGVSYDGIDNLHIKVGEE